MIQVNDACKIVMSIEKNIFVNKITDIGSEYVIGVVGANGEIPDIQPYAVNKLNGEVNAYFVPYHIQELNNGKIIPVPDKYLYKK